MQKIMMQKYRWECLSPVQNIEDFETGEVCLSQKVYGNIT